MSYDAGSAFVQIVPSLEGFVRKISDEADRAGADAAESFKASFRASLGSLATTLKLDDAEAQSKLDEVRIKSDQLGAKSPEIRVKVDGAGAVAELGAVKAAADDASGSGGGLSGLLGLGKSAAGAGSDLGGVAEAVGGVAGVLGLLATALIPVGAAVAGVALGFTGMAVAATAGIGAFAVAALPVMTQVTAAYQQINADQTALNRATSTAQKNTALTHLQDDLNNLSPVVATVTLGLIQAKSTMQTWSAQFDPLIVRVFNAALGDLKPILQAVNPLVQAGGDALANFFGVIGQQVRAPDFQKFVSWLSTEVGPAMAALQTAFDNFAGGFSKMLENSGPLITLVEGGLVNLSAGFESFAESKTFKSFVDYVVTNGPAVGAALENIATAVGHVVIGFAPIGLTVLNGLGGLASAISSFPTADITAIGVAFGIWAVSASPILALAAALVAVGLAIHQINADGKLDFKSMTAADYKNAFAAAWGGKTQADSAAAAHAKNLGLTPGQIASGYAATRSTIVPGGSGYTSRTDSVTLGPGGVKPPPAPAGAGDQSGVGGVLGAQNRARAAHDVMAFSNQLSHWLDNMDSGIANWITKSLPHAISRAWHGVQTTLFSPLAGAVRTSWHDASHQLDNITGGVSNWITRSVPHAVSRAWHGVQTTLFSPLAGAVRTGWHDASHELDNVIGGISNWITKSVPHAFSRIGEFFQHGFDGATNALDTARHLVAQAFDTVTTDISNWVTKSVPHAFDSIGEFFRHGFDAATNALDAARHAVATAVDNVTSDISNWVTNSVPHAFDGIRHAIASAFDGAESWLVGVGKGLINGLIEGIDKAIDAINSNIPSVLGHKLFPSIPDIPKIPEHAEGTGMGTFQGLTWVGEKGPELINLAAPAQIISNAQLRSMGSIDLSHVGVGAGHKSGPALSIGQAIFKDEADFEMIQRKTTWAYLKSGL